VCSSDLILNVPLGTVKSRFTRARNLIEKSLGSRIKLQDALDLFPSRNLSVVSVTDVSVQLHDALIDDPNLLKKFSPAQFELFIADCLDRMGYNVELTGSTNASDGGIDLIAVPKTGPVSSFLLAGQVKHHSGNQKVGINEVQRFANLRGSKFSMGLLVTNTGFTKNALWEAALDKNKGFLRLRDFEDLKRWIMDNFWDVKEWREIPDSIELAPGINIKVPKLILPNMSDIWPSGKIEKL
jgi:restriction endonuclease Mrr